MSLILRFSGYNDNAVQDMILRLKISASFENKV